jgi:hypothetical protein
VDLGLGSLESGLELIAHSIEIPDMGSGCMRSMSVVVTLVHKVEHTTIEQGDFAGLLVGGGQRLAETCVTLTKFVSPPLLRLDPLFADGLAARVGAYGGRRGRVEILIFLVTVHVVAGGLPLCRAAGGWCGDGVEAVRAGDGSWVGDTLGRRGGRVSSTATTASARLRAIRGHLASADVVKTSGGDACTVEGGEWARGGGGSSVGGSTWVSRIVGEVARQVQRIKAETRRVRGRSGKTHL